MINKQKIFFFLIVLLSCNYQFGSIDIPDLSSWEDVVDQEGGDFPDYEKMHYDTWKTVQALTRSCALDPEGIIKAQDILQNDLYDFTHPINQRSIQDLPEFYFFLLQRPTGQCASWQLLVEAFYNETHKANFTKDSTAISSYLNFGIAREFEQFAFGLDLPHLLSLFENIKVQERRAGVMFGGLRSWGNWYVHFRTPLEYLVRNFYLSVAERKEIAAEPLFVTTSTTAEEEAMTLARQHLIADRLGIGDTRVNVGYTAIENPCLLWDVGLEATLPTAFAFKKGLFGTHFPKYQRAPTLDLTMLLNLLQGSEKDQAQAQDIGVKFLIQAMDRLSRILLETGLGNNGHVGLGVFTYNDLCLNNNFNIKTRATLEYLLPGNEWRYYIQKKDKADFDALKQVDPDHCEKQLMFLQDEIVNILFPKGLSTMVYPGFIFKYTSAFSGTLAKRWELNLGYDIWWQQKEKLGKIYTSASESGLLRKDIATRPAAFQAKIFGSATVFKKYPTCTRDWSLSLYIDKTFLRSGIGKDFNIALRFELLL